MTGRPADLPDFTAPPVTEVVLGVQFNSIDRFLSPHLGLVWERFKPSFPDVEEHPPVPPSFETFGQLPQSIPTVHLQLALVEMPRVFFINKDKTQLLQVQKDRFLHNWRKVGTGDNYPRFERMLETFENGFRTFEGVIAEERLGAVLPNQCEVTYINQIPASQNSDLSDVFQTLFPGYAAGFKLNDLGNPEDLRFIIRYVMRDKNSAPIGRLLVAAEPARRVDGASIVQLTLTARGKPTSSDMPGVIEFLERGRAHMGRAFVKLTSPAMHQLWGRTQ